MGKTARVRAHKRKGTGGVRSHNRSVKGKVKRAIPTKVDDEIIDLMLENMDLGDQLNRLKKEWTGIQAKISKTERGFGKGTPLVKDLKRQQNKVFGEMKGIQKQQKWIGSEIKRLYEPLPKAKKSGVMLEFTKRYEKIRGRPLMR